MIVIDITKCKRSAYATENTSTLPMIATAKVEKPSGKGFTAIKPVEYKHGLRVAKPKSAPVFDMI